MAEVRNPAVLGNQPVIASVRGLMPTRKWWAAIVASLVPNSDAPGGVPVTSA